MLIEGFVRELSRNWGWIALRGVAAIVFGALTFVWPQVTLLTLTFLWGAYAIADGVMSLLAGFQMKDGGKPTWTLVIVGVLGIVAGIVAFLMPGITALALLMLIAAWAIATGILQVIAAVRFRKEIDNEWWLILAGVVSVLFGVAMIARPGAGALAVVYVIGAYAILFGALLLALALRLRGVGQRLGAHTGAART
jgi:uncharacterized membrane protein HdeD (DUF308 family)